MNKMGERGPGIKKSGSRFLPIGMIAGPAGGIVTALLSNWKLAIFGILLAIIGYQNFMSFEMLKPFGLRTVPGVEQDVEHAERKFQIATEQLTECELGRERLKDEIAQTNAEIDRWVVLSQQLQQNQTELNATLSSLQEKSKTEVEIIIEGPIPQTCKGAIKYLKDAVTKGELRWKTNG